MAVMVPRTHQAGVFSGAYLTQPAAAETAKTAPTVERQTPSTIYWCTESRTAERIIASPAQGCRKLALPGPSRHDPPDLLVCRTAARQHCPELIDQFKRTWFTSLLSNPPFTDTSNLSVVCPPFIRNGYGRYNMIRSGICPPLLTAKNVCQRVASAPSDREAVLQVYPSDRG